MNKLKITTGEWYKSERPIEQNEHGVYMLDIDTPMVISILTVWSPNDPNNEEELDIVELCCDAGNTYQKCGLLPSELLKQRDKMIEVLNELQTYIRLVGVNKSLPISLIYKKITELTASIEKQENETK